MSPAEPTEVAAGIQRKLRQLAELPVAQLHQVGPRTERELAELGIGSVLDLLTHYPRRYLDGTRLRPIAELVAGEKVSVLARVTRVRPASSGYGRGRRRGPSRVEVEIADDSGRLRVVYFNQTWRAKQLPSGTEAIFFGKVTEYRGARQLTNPVVDVVAGVTSARRTLRILPVYPASAKALIWWRHEYQDSGQPCTRMTSGPLPISAMRIRIPLA